MVLMHPEHFLVCYIYLIGFESSVCSYWLYFTVSNKIQCTGLLGLDIFLLYVLVQYYEKREGQTSFGAKLKMAKNSNFLNNHFSINVNLSV